MLLVIHERASHGLLLYVPVLYVVAVPAIVCLIPECLYSISAGCYCFVLSLVVPHLAHCKENVRLYFVSSQRHYKIASYVC